MENPKLIHAFQSISKPIQEKSENPQPVRSYRFDIFKGVTETDGKIKKVRSAGHAYLRDGVRTYSIILKSLLKDHFFLLPNTKEDRQSDFIILTREPALQLDRKYYWNYVGEGKYLDGLNSGLLKLNWDVFAQDLYMNLHPIQTSEVKETSRVDAAA